LLQSLYVADDPGHDKCWWNELFLKVSIDAIITISSGVSLTRPHWLSAMVLGLVSQQITPEVESLAALGISTDVARLNNDELVANVICA